MSSPKRSNSPSKSPSRVSEPSTSSKKQLEALFGESDDEDSKNSNNNTDNNIDEQGEASAVATPAAAEDNEDLFGDENDDNNDVDNKRASTPAMEKEDDDNDLFGDDDDNDDTQQQRLRGKVRRRIADDDDEDGMNAAGSDDDNNEATAGVPYSGSSSRMQGEEGGEEEEEEMLEEVVEDENLVTIEGAIPDLDIPTAEKENLYLVRLPNFLDVEPIPFDAATFQEEEDGDDDFVDDLIKLKVENTLRWKYIKDRNGNMVKKESNSRLIRWSDGTFSLLLGEELFEVSVHSMENEQQYLVAQYALDGYFHSQSRFHKQMTFRPHSTNSITHKKLTQAIANKHKKEMKTKTFTPEVHPETDLIAVEKAENERMKSRRRLEAQRRNANRAAGGLNDEFLEEDDDALYPRSHSYGVENEYDVEDDFVVDDEEEEEEERKRGERAMKAKSGSSSSKKRSRRDYSDESEEEGEEDHEDSGKNSKRRAAADEPAEEDSEEDDGFAIKKNSNKRRAIGSESDSE